jgi:hypothetical protein
MYDDILACMLLFGTRLVNSFEELIKQWQRKKSNQVSPLAFPID